MCAAAVEVLYFECDNQFKKLIQMIGIVSVYLVVYTPFNLILAFQSNSFSYVSIINLNIMTLLRAYWQIHSIADINRVDSSVEVSIMCWWWAPEWKDILVECERFLIEAEMWLITLWSTSQSLVPHITNVWE